MGGVLQAIRSILIGGFGLIVALGSGLALLGGFLRPLVATRTRIVLIVSATLGLTLFFFSAQMVPNAIEYPLFVKTFGPASEHPSLPLKNVIRFFLAYDDFARVGDIAASPTTVPTPISRDHPETVEVKLETKEVLSEVAPGIVQNYWTFNEQVPGPMLRVRQGDRVHVELTNNKTSLHPHNIDFHAVTGPGGGATVTTVNPGETKDFTFTALNPGLYIYHCAVPNVAVHMAHGMYGLILVEPEGGLPPVDQEFYVVQGEFYATGKLGKTGLQVFDGEALMESRPQYVVFNGRTGALAENMQAKVGDKIRIFVGNGGVNLISSFHVIGEIFDEVYPEGAVGSETRKNIQTTLVPAGGATMVEFQVQVPGRYLLVDHALARLDRGVWGVLTVTGDENKAVFDGVSDTNPMPGH